MKNFLFLFLLINGSFLHAQQFSNSPPLVTVTGEGIVKVVPDQVIINSRIEHEGEDAQQVKKMNDNVVDKIIEYLRSQGIPENNIKTAYINLNKTYNYNDKTYSYVANQSLTIKLEDLRGYEFIMTGLLEAGLNRIDGIEFKSSGIETYRKEARKLAVLNARSKAEEYAVALDQEIGKAYSISEVESNHLSPVYRSEMMKSNMEEGGQETLAPGEMEVRTNVTVAFELN